MIYACLFMFFFFYFRTKSVSNIFAYNLKLLFITRMEYAVSNFILLFHSFYFRIKILFYENCAFILVLHITCIFLLSGFLTLLNTIIFNRIHLSGTPPWSFDQIQKIANIIIKSEIWIFFFNILTVVSAGFSLIIA